MWGNLGATIGYLKTNLNVLFQIMPRTYIKKTAPKYGSDDLENATKEVEKGSSVYAAAKMFNIPYETLRRWREHPPSHQGAGRGTVLSKEEEKYIVSALQYTAKCGYPMDRQDLKYGN